MRFDFVEVEGVIAALDRLQASDAGPDESRSDTRYRASVRTVLEAFSGGLDDLSCRLTDRQSWHSDGDTASGHDQRPLWFDIEPVMPTPLVHTFDHFLSRVDTYDHRIRVLGIGHGATPAAALRSLRRRGLVVQLELRNESGTFEPLLWATDTQVYTEGVAGYDIHREPDIVDKSVQARLLSRHEEFARTGEAGDGDCVGP